MSRRAAFIGVFLACAGLLGYGYYLEYAQGLAPCALCVMQRAAFAAVGLVALVAAAHGPRGWAARAYAGLGLVGAAAGAGVAARHVYLQRLPADAVPSCGPGLSYLVETFPLHQALAQVLRGSGDCAEKAAWSFLGLGIPEWALVWFLGLAVVMLVVLARPAPRRAQG